jgi:CheY-like chemotaxis protein
MSRFKFDQVTLIDDDAVVKILMIKILRKIGFEGSILEFEDGKKALEEIQMLDSDLPAGGINLILLDINMPEMNGWGFLDRITLLPENWKKKQFITMITSSIDNTDKIKAFGYQEVKDFIQKPVSIPLLKEFLSQHKLIED